MSKREEVVEIVNSMMDYFDADYWEDLDSLLKMDLMCEVEECLDINIPLSIFDEPLTKSQFVEACLGVWEQQS